MLLLVTLHQVLSAVV